MFKKNIEAIKIKNPTLAEKLEKINIETIKNVLVYQADSGDYIISYNNTLMHNTEDPVREAKSVWYKAIKSEFHKNDIQIIFGLGMGYLLKRAYLNSTSKIYIIEPFIELLRFVLEYVDFSQEFQDDRIFITDNLTELTKKIQNEYLNGDKIEFLFLNSYIKLSQQMLVELTNQVLNICESKSVDQNTIFNQCKLWTQNSILNISSFANARPHSYLANKFSNKTALIISAGPSLAENIEKIKQNRDKFVIIAVCSIYKYLLKNNITPDFITFADSRFLVEHVRGEEESLKNMNIVINSRADNYIFEQEAKSKFVAFSSTDDISSWIQKSMNADIKLDKSGGTVSILSYYFAKSLGCNPIVFTGLDLAFINNKVYANGMEMEVNQNGTLKIPAESVKKVSYVKSANGEMVPTRDDYLAFVRQFNEIFTEEEQDERIINTSLSGAYIKGMDYMSFDEMLDTIDSSEIDVNKEISAIIKSTKTGWKQANSLLIKQAKIEYENIKKFDLEANNTYQKLQELCELFEMHKDKMGTIDSKIEELKHPLNSIRTMAVNNSFLSSYLQCELLEYTRNYRTNLLLSIDDIKNNMQVEMKFVKVVCSATENINNWFEQLFNNIENACCFK